MSKSWAGRSGEAGQAGRAGRVGRLTGAALAAALLAGGAAACGSNGAGADGAGAVAGRAGAPPTASPTPSATPEPFSALVGYRGLKPGMTKDVALATGALEAAPVSLLNGCTDFAYRSGPAPDPVRMAAEEALQAKYVQANARNEAARKETEVFPAPPASYSAKDVKSFTDRMAAFQEKSKARQEAHEQLMKVFDELKAAREARDLAFLTTGRAGFGLEGLRELVAPAGARTAEGIGAGSTVAELKAAYEVQGLQLGKDGKYTLWAGIGQVEQGWRYEFTVDAERVTGLALANRDTYCS
ncbi:hypothetical protein [Kitasatospora purpeofusca]|uniref:hypothetical protein n=1 Tax=Kitasatospora purpeofusca TaxID=67352 RepID=UPI00068ACBAF|nr:hypothetical protein [Kitasatospora purpeofusca]